MSPYAKDKATRPLEESIADAIATLRHIRDDAEHRAAALEGAANEGDAEPMFALTDIARLDDLQRLSDAATPGPWIRAYGSYDVHHIAVQMGGAFALRSMEDIDFAVASASFVRDLLSERFDTLDGWQARVYSILRSHAFGPCDVCGAAVDDPEGAETCEGPRVDHEPGASVEFITPEQNRAQGR